MFWIVKWFFDTPIREPEQIHRDTVRKLKKARINDEDFRAVLGCLLGEKFTTPRLVELFVSQEGVVLGRPEDLDYHGKLVGSTRALLKEIQGLTKVADLDGDEVSYLMVKVAQIKWRK